MSIDKTVPKKLFLLLSKSFLTKLWGASVSLIHVEKILVLFHLNLKSIISIRQKQNFNRLLQFSRRVSPGKSYFISSWLNIKVISILNTI